MSTQNNPHRSASQLFGELNLIKDIWFPGSRGPAKSRLAGALKIACDALEAESGYLAIFRQHHKPGDPPQWWTAISMPEDQRIVVHHRFSTTVIDDALKRRQVLMVPSALGHPRYAEAESVRVNRITAVLCVPIGTKGRGILYLQGKRTGGVFDATDEAWLADLGRSLGVYVGRGQHGEASHASQRLSVDHVLPGLQGTSPFITAARAEAMESLQTSGHLLIRGGTGTGKTTFARALSLISRGESNETLELTAARFLRIWDDESAPSQMRDQRIPLIIEVTSPATRQDLLAAHLAGMPDRTILCIVPSSLHLEPSLAQHFGEAVIEMPPLASRLDDVPSIALHMAHRRQADLPTRSVALYESDLTFLVSQASRLNLYEVEGLVDDILTWHADRANPTVSLMPPPPAAQAHPNPVQVDYGFDTDQPMTLRDARADVTRRYLSAVMSHCEGRVSEAAQITGLSRSRLYALLEQHNLLMVGRRT